MICTTTYDDDAGLNDESIAFWYCGRVNLRICNVDDAIEVANDIASYNIKADLHQTCE